MHQFTFQQCTKFPVYSHFHQNLLFLGFFDNSHLNTCEVLAHCGFDPGLGTFGCCKGSQKNCFKKFYRNSRCGAVEMNPTRKHEVGLIPGLTQWVKEPALP